MTGHYDLAALVAAALLVVAPAQGQTQEEGNGFLAAQQWPQAAAAYEALLATDSSNATLWFNLGQARYGDGDGERAREALLHAIDTGYAPLPRARFVLARVLASLDDRNAALAQLEEIAKTGGASWRRVQGATEFKNIATTPRFLTVIETLKPCNTDVFRHFDFWLGHWDVTQAGATQPTASNKLSSIQDGCVMLEEYTAGTFTGMSINFYDAVSEKWHQTWMSNAGGSLYLEGNLDSEGAMVLTDADLPVSAKSGSINKVRWSKNDDGSVRQLWNVSTDGGKTWNVIFDGRYTRRVEE